MVLAPVSLEIGGHLRRRIELGADVAIAPSTGLTCFPCSGASLWSVGVKLRVHMAPGRVVDPWVAGGVGFERITLPSGINATGSPSFNGVELPRMQAGLDLHVVEGLVLGPYASAEVVWYEPDAPAWATVSHVPLPCTAGVRVGYAF
jgi:hypothetical protein